MRAKAVLFWLAAFLLILLPFLGQAARTPPGSLPLGQLAGGQDYATYLAKIELGRQGAWVYRDVFTPEKTEPVPIYWFYLALGHLGRLTGLSSLWLFHLARAFFGASALLSVWLLARREDPGSALWGAVAGCLGMSWLIAVLPRMVLPLGHVLGGLLAFPHYMADLLGWCGLLYAWEMRGWKRLVLVLVSANLLCIHPFLLLPACLLPVFRSLWAGGRAGPSLRHSALVAACGLPQALWVAVSFSRAPWTAEWRDQAVRVGANVAVLPVAFGLIFWLAAWRLLGRCREDGIWAGWLFSCWVSAVVCRAAGFPRNWWEMLFEVSLPLGVLAARELGRFRRPAGVLVLSAACLLGFLVWGSGLLGLSEPAFLPGPSVETFSVLAHEAKGEAALVLPVEAGNLVPYLTGCSVRPYLGHSSETLRFREKVEAVRAFLRGGPLPEGVRWVLEVDVPDVLCRKYWPEVSRELASRPDLKLAWSGEGGRLWRVAESEGKEETVR